MDGAALAQSARELMLWTRADDDRAFDVVDGEWVQSAPADALAGSADADAEALVAELRAEVLMLRGSYKRLRVTALEARVEHIPARGGVPERAHEPTLATLAQSTAAPLLAALELPPPSPEATPARRIMLPSGTEREVCNTLSSSVGDVAQNGAIRAAPVELFAPDRLRWLAASAWRSRVHRLDRGALMGTDELASCSGRQSARRQLQGPRGNHGLCAGDRDAILATLA